MDEALIETIRDNRILIMTQPILSGNLEIPISATLERNVPCTFNPYARCWIRG